MAQQVDPLGAISIGEGFMVMDDYSVSSSPTMTSSINDGIPMMSSKDYLAWMDSETTGLDTEKDKILEVALVITDKDLNEVESFTIAIRQTDSTFSNMSYWASEAHNSKSCTSSLSLVESCKNPEYSMDLEGVELHICQILDKYRGRGCLVLCGSSVYVDKLFIKKWMPKVDERLHYRLMDVSAILESVKRWIPSIMKYQPENTVEHRAIADIRSSIDLMRFYKNNLFVEPTRLSATPSFDLYQDSFKRKKNTGKLQSFSPIRNSNNNLSNGYRPNMEPACKNTTGKGIDCIKYNKS